MYFFFNDTATTEIYTLTLHDALPISHARSAGSRSRKSRLSASAFVGPVVSSVISFGAGRLTMSSTFSPGIRDREEHTSELQSPCNLVCRLLLVKKKLYLHHIVQLA